MPGTPHEVVLLAIRENPELFAELLRRVVGTDMPGPIEVMDSNVRRVEIHDRGVRYPRFRSVARITVA